MTSHTDSNAQAMPCNGEAGIYPRLINLGGVLIPVGGLVVGLWMLWGTHFNWVYLSLMVGMYLVSGFGITIGYHRLFTHRSFRTSKWVSAVLAITGSMAVEGSVLHWVAVHRKHHHHSDDENDPHSPHACGGGLRGTLRGMWHAHMGWSLGRRKMNDLAGYVHDLRKDRVLVWISRLFPVWVALGLAIPAILGGLLTMSWMGFLLGFLWGGLVRILLVHHATWSINSVCHLWGSQPYVSRDESRNNAILGIIALGEGWHNNHHAFPSSARHGLAWWQLDVSYLVILGMKWIGLASNVRIPTAEALAHRRVYRSDGAGISLQ